MADSLLQELRSGDSVKTRQWKGLVPGRNQGGLSPRRVLNLCWLLLRASIGLALGPSDRVVIIRSTPPLLHLPVGAICRWRGIRCVFWLMDYHPEIERRLWGRRRWLSPLLKWLDRWDRRALAGFSRIVVLDDAMANLVRERCPQARVSMHPTWGPRTMGGADEDGRGSFKSGNESDPVVFAYLGNLGLGHDWTTLEACIRAVAARRPVRLLTVGLPVAAEPFFAMLSGELGCEWERHPRMPFVRAAALLRERGAHWGCVAMRGDLGGCLSPSKFSGYLSAGLPLLYAGPPKTNAWKVCVEFGGGVSLADGATQEEVGRAADQLADPSAWAKAAKGMLSARAHFESFGGDTLAAMIRGAIDERRA